MPGTEICLMTDKMPAQTLGGNVVVELINPAHIRAKVDYLANSPFDKTVYLDSDTLLEHNIEELFVLLDRFDVLATHDWARKRQSLSNKIPEYGQIPYAFSEVNGGVLAWANRPGTRAWLDRWRELYYQHQNPGGRDQATLRMSLWESDVSLYILPPEFNLRGRRARAQVKKQRKKMGPDHLKPRIIHLHADESIHSGRAPSGSFSFWRFLMRRKADSL